MPLILNSHSKRTFYDNSAWGIGFEYLPKLDNLPPINLTVRIKGVEYEFMEMSKGLIYYYHHRRELNGFRKLRKHILKSHPNLQCDLNSKDPLGEDNFIPDKVWNNRTLRNWENIKFKEIPNEIYQELLETQQQLILKLEELNEGYLFKSLNYFLLTNIEISTDIPIRAGIDLATSESFHRAFAEVNKISKFGYHTNKPVSELTEEEALMNLSEEFRSGAGMISTVIVHGDPIGRPVFEMREQDDVIWKNYVKETPKGDSSGVGKNWLFRFEQRFFSEKSGKKISGSDKIKQKFGSNRFSSPKDLEFLLRSMCEEQFQFLQSKFSGVEIEYTDLERFCLLYSKIEDYCTYKSMTILKLLTTGSCRIDSSQIKANRLRKSQLNAAHKAGLLTRTSVKNSLYAIDWTFLGLGYREDEMKKLASEYFETTTSPSL